MLRSTYRNGNPLNHLKAPSLFMAIVLCVASSGFAQAPGTQTPESTSLPESTTSLPQSNNSNNTQSTPTAPQTSPILSGGLGDGPIQAGDMVDVQVFDAPELSVKALVSQNGDIPVPLLKSFHIAGMTSLEAGTALSNEFVLRKFLQNPSIIVTVQQSANGVTVLGAVRTPGVYPLVGKHRLIDLLARAGGPNETAAHVIEINGPEPNETKRVIWDPTFQENPAIHVLIEPGQSVLVGRCGVAYLGGNLGRPGAYPLCASRHMTLSEAIALAGGVKPSSSGSRTVLLRVENGTRAIRVVDVEAILRGKTPDFTLNSDDIIYVPASAFKASMKVVGQAAINFSLAAALFRIQNN